MKQVSNAVVFDSMEQTMAGEGLQPRTTVMPQVLIVDDSPCIVDVLGSMVAAMGFAPFLTTSGNEAWDALERSTFDVLITDILMPDTDGNDLLRKCAQIDHRPGIIAISGGGATMDAHQALSLAARQADITLKKPVAQDEIQCAIQDVLDVHGV